MDAETLARATEPFFTTKGVGKGTGLALPMTHGLAKQSDGDLRIRSARDQRAKVELWLQVADAAEASTVKPREVEVSTIPAICASWPLTMIRWCW